MFLLDIIAWIIIGGVAGWLASLVVRGSGLGILGDIIAGIVGAIVGGIILSVFFGTAGFTGFNWWSLLVAFIGAVIVLLIVRLFAGSRASSRV